MGNIIGKSLTLRSKRFRRRMRNWYVSARRGLRIELLEDRRLLAVSPLGDEFLVNSYTNGAQQTWAAANAVRVGSAGVFDITFNGKGQDDSNGAFVRRFNAGGQPLGVDQLVNQTTAGDQEDSSIAGAANGDFVVVWSGKGSGDNDGVFLQRYRVNGTKNGIELLVNTTTIKSKSNQLWPWLLTDNL